MLIDIIFATIGIFALFFAIILFIAVKRVLKTGKGTNEKIKIGESVIVVKKTGNKKLVLENFDNKIKRGFTGDL